MIEIKNVTKSFQKKNNQNKIETFLADNNISFTAMEGEVLGILGPNGAGKTTTIKSIVGILDFEEGDTVTVTGGAWEGTVGMIQTINMAKQSLTINVDLFGRETPVEISFAEVKKM